MTTSITFRAALSLVLFVGFYVFGLAVAGVLLFFAWELATHVRNAISFKLAWACVAGAGVLLWSLRPRRDQFEPPGPRITEDDQPALFGLIRDVSGAAGQPPPDVVFVTSDMTAWVANRGGTMGLGGERVMTLGLSLLQILTVGELKAVIAHELGHFSGGDTRLGHVVYRTRVALARTLEETQGRFVELMFRAYAVLFMRTSMAVSRSQEFAADAFAARLTDPGALASSLTKLDRTAIAFPFYRMMSFGSVLAAGYRPPLAAGFHRFLDHPLAQQIAQQVAANPPERSVYDSHPPTQERVAALAAMPAAARTTPSEPGSPDRQPAISLVRNLSQLEAIILASEGIESGRLTVIDWLEVPTRVYVPMWRGVVEKHIHALRELMIDALPATRADLLMYGRRIATTEIKLMEPDDLVTRMSGALAAAVAVRLHDAGWKLSDAAGLHFTRDELTVEPFVDIPAVVSGDADAVAKWKATCAAAGLTGALVAESRV